MAMCAAAVQAEVVNAVLVGFKGARRLHHDGHAPCINVLDFASRALRRERGPGQSEWRDPEARVAFGR